MELAPSVKKILYVILFIGAVAAFLFLLYIIFFKPAPPTQPDTNVNNGNIGLPNVNNANGAPNGNVNEAPPSGIPGIDAVASGGLTQSETITPNVYANDPSVATDGTIHYYYPNDGKFYTVDSNGNIKQLGNATFNGAEKVTWADSTDEAIIEFPDGANIYYNFDTDQQVTLPKEYEDFDFSPNSSAISFKYMHIDPERRVLAVSNPDGSSARTLESLGLNAERVTVDWSPKGTVAARYAEFIDANRQEMGFVGLNGENFKTTIVEGRGLRSTYSPDGEQLLYSTYSKNTSYKPTLWVVDADAENIGKNRKQINVNTFADKCAFGSDSSVVYCGVPTESKFGFGLEPDILKDVPDDIYRIDLNTGVQQRIAVPVNNSGKNTYSIKKLFITNDDSTLVFQDSDTRQLVKVNLQ